MASGKSGYLEKTLLDYVLGGVSFTPPGTLYVALSTAAWAATATGTSMSEVSFTSTAYARVAVTNNATNFPAATGSGPASKSNGTDITFPAATTGWGTVQSVYLADAATAGNLLYGGNLDTAKVVSNTDIPMFLAGSLIFTEL